MSRVDDIERRRTIAYALEPDEAALAHAMLDIDFLLSDREQLVRDIIAAVEAELLDPISQESLEAAGRAMRTNNGIRKAIQAIKSVAKQHEIEVANNLPAYTR